MGPQLLPPAHEKLSLKPFQALPHTTSIYKCFTQRFLDVLTAHPFSQPRFYFSDCCLFRDDFSILKPVWATLIPSAQHGEVIKSSNSSFCPQKIGEKKKQPKGRARVAGAALSSLPSPSWDCPCPCLCPCPGCPCPQPDCLCPSCPLHQSHVPVATVPSGTAQSHRRCHQRAQGTLRARCPGDISPAGCCDSDPEPEQSTRDRRERSTKDGDAVGATSAAGTALSPAPRSPAGRVAVPPLPAVTAVTKCGAHGNSRLGSPEGWEEKTKEEEEEMELREAGGGSRGDRDGGERWQRGHRGQEGTQGTGGWRRGDPAPGAGSCQPDSIP